MMPLATIERLFSRASVSLSCKRAYWTRQGRRNSEKVQIKVFPGSVYLGQKKTRHTNRKSSLNQVLTSLTLSLPSRCFCFDLLAYGDRLRETISIHTWLSSIGRWLIEANPVLDKISNKKKDLPFR